VVATFEPKSGVPPLITHLLAEFPELLVVAISLRQQRARIYRRGGKVRTIAEFTVSGIIRAIVEAAAPSDHAGED
jgi:hypothetical protein